MLDCLENNIDTRLDHLIMTLLQCLLIMIRNINVLFDSEYLCRSFNRQIVLQLGTTTK